MKCSECGFEMIIKSYGFGKTVYECRTCKITKTE